MVVKSDYKSVGKNWHWSVEKICQMIDDCKLSYTLIYTNYDV